MHDTVEVRESVIIFVLLYSHILKVGCGVMVRDQLSVHVYCLAYEIEYCGRLIHIRRL